MGTGKANPGGAERKHSKLDLENVDSWLPPEVAPSLSRMIAARNRKQLRDGDAASSYAYDTGARGVERDDPSGSDDDYRTLLCWESLAAGCAESPEDDLQETGVSSEVPPDEETVRDLGEFDDFYG